MTIELVPTWTPGDFLRKAREAAGLTQRELAAKMRIDHSTLVDAEKNHRHPREERIMAWARATGVSYEWLQWNVDACAQADMEFDLDFAKHTAPAEATVTELLPRLDSNQQPADYQQLQVAA